MKAKVKGMLASRNDLEVTLENLVRIVNDDDNRSNVVLLRETYDEILELQQQYRQRFGEFYHIPENNNI